MLGDQKGSFHVVRTLSLVLLLTHSPLLAAGLRTTEILLPVPVRAFSRYVAVGETTLFQIGSSRTGSTLSPLARELCTYLCMHKTRFERFAILLHHYQLLSSTHIEVFLWLSDRRSRIDGVAKGDEAISLRLASNTISRDDRIL